MNNKKDYYEILEVNKNASEEEIKKSYKKLALAHHPDKNIGNPDSVEKFKEIGEAYGVLSDKSKRTQYDMVGSAEDFGDFGGDPFSVFNSIFKNHMESFMNMKYEKEVNVSNIFSNLSGMPEDAFSFGNVHIKVHTFPVNNIFEDKRRIDEDGDADFDEDDDNNNPFMGLFGRKKSEPKIIYQKPDDIIYNVKASFADIYNNEKKKVTITRMRKKNGKYAEKKKTIIIPISGKEVFLEGQGHEMKDYKERGDVLIYIENEVDESFKRINEYDMLYIKELDYEMIYDVLKYELILPHGQVIKIYSEPLVEQQNMIQKILDMGLPYFDDSGKRANGDLYVIYKIIFPKREKEDSSGKLSYDKSYIRSYECDFGELFKQEC